MLKALKKLARQLQATLKSDIKLRVAAVFSVLAVITLLLYAMITQPTVTPSKSALNTDTVAIESLVAIDSVSGLVSSTPTFRVMVPENTQLAALQNSIQAVPTTPLVYEAVSPTEFTIKPKAPLAKGAVLSLAYQTAEGLTSQAFQVTGSLTLKSVYPANDATEVPLNTGLELLFSEAVDSAILEHITLSPEVAFDSEIQDNLVRLIPKSRLSKDTLYTLTLSGDYESKLGARFSQTRSIQFFTGDRKAYEQRTVLTTHLYQDNEPLHLDLNYSLVANDFDVKIYALPDAVTLSQQHQQLQALSDRFVQPEKQLERSEETPIFEGKLPANTLGEASPVRYLQLPELTAGAYRIECTSDLGNQVAFVQISPLAVYFEFDSTKQQGLLWALEAKTAQPASVTVAPLSALKDDMILSSQDLLGTTDAEGILRFALKNGFEDLIVTTKEQMVWIPSNAFSDYSDYGFYNPDLVANSTVSDAKAAKSDVFEQRTDTPEPMTFFYTDRIFYAPGEPVHLFGILRFADKRALNKVWIRTTEDSTVPPVEVPVDALGTFHIEVPQTFLQYQDQYNVIEIGSEYGLLGSHGFGLGYYEKPEVLVDLSIEKTILGPNDPLVISGSVEHVDGSAMSDYRLNLLADGLSIDSAAASAKTDAFGQYQIQVPLKPTDNTYTSAFYYRHVEVSSAETENVEASAAREIVHFPSTTILDIEPLTTSDNGTGRGSFIVTANTLKLPESWSELDDDKNYKGAPLTLQAAYTLEESYFDRIPDAEVYDPVLKEKVTKYRYEYRSAIVDSGSLAIEKGKAQYDFSLLPERSYTLNVKVTDEAGATVSSLAYLSAPSSMSTAMEKALPEDAPMALKHLFVPEDQLPTLPWRVTFKPGADFEVPLTIPNSLRAITDAKTAKTLFIEYDQHYKAHEVQSGLEPTYTGRIDSSGLPSGAVKAIFYDGYRFQSTGEPPVTILVLAPEVLNLSLNIATDKVSYGPGDTVKGTVTLKADNAPVSGSVFVSVVDTAYLALYPESLQAREQFYSPHYRTGVTLSYHTSANVNASMAEMGEGDASGGYIRENFKSTAHAELITVDSTGRATFSFVLPDNITIWRIAAHGIDQAGNLGTSYKNATCTKPFYLRYLLAPTLTRFDEPILLLSGRLLSQLEPLAVDYDWQLNLKDAIVNSGTASGQTNERVPLSLGQLKTGSYSLLIKGQTQGKPALQDQVKLPLAVVDSLVQFPATQGLTLDKGSSWESPTSKESSTLTIWHTEARAWRNELQQLQSGNAKRLEQYLAAWLAPKLMLDAKQSPQMPEDFLDAFITTDYQANIPMSYKPLVSAESSLQLTADVITVIPEPHRQSQTWQSIYENAVLPLEDMDAQIELLRARAALKQPVLFDLHQIAKQSLNASQRLSVAWAFLSLGDREMAKLQYAEHKTALAMNATDAVRLKYLTAIVSAGLNLPEAAQRYEQAKDATPKQHDYQLLQLAYLTLAEQRYEPITLTVQQFGGAQASKAQTLSLEGNEPIHIELPPGVTLKVSEASDLVDIFLDYTGQLDTVDFQLEGYALQRHFSKTNVGLGETIHVEVVIDCPANAYFRAFETIPPGFNAVTKQGVITGNQLVLYPTSASTKHRYEYTLKPSMAGRFLSEPTILAGYGSEDTAGVGYLKGDEVYLNVNP